MTGYLRISLAALILPGAASCSTPIDPVQQASATQTCINPARVREHEVISNDEIRFTLAGGEVWTNRLPRSCPGLKVQGGFTWDVSTSACSGTQIIYVNESGTPCQLGEFTRVATEPSQG